MTDKTPEERIREALRQVEDPELGMNVVDLGFIREIEAGDDGFKITMILTTPFCPLAHMLVSQVQEAAENAVDEPIEVVMGDEQWNPAMMKGQA